MKTTQDSIEQTATRRGTKKASNDDRTTVIKYYYFNEMYGDKTGTACSTPKRGEKCTQKLVGAEEITWKTYM